MNEPAATVVALAAGAVVGLVASLVHAPEVRFEPLATILLGTASAGLGHSLAAGIGMRGTTDWGVSLGVAVVLVVLAKSLGAFRGRGSIR